MSCLYVIHLLVAVTQQVGETAELDTYSGKSHLSRFARSLGIDRDDRIEMLTHLWIQPLLVLIVAAAVRLLTSQILLPVWLTVIAASLCAKELRNY